MTASDLARCDIALMQGRILSATSLSELSREIALQNGAGTGSGLGIDVTLPSGRRVLGHGGEIDGVTAQHLIYPDDGVAVVVSINQEAVNVSEAIASVVHIASDASCASGCGDTRSGSARIFRASARHARRRSAHREWPQPFFFRRAREFQSSLAPPRAPTAFELTRTGLRGGFAVREYTVTCAGRKLKVVVRATRADCLSSTRSALSEG